MTTALIEVSRIAIPKLFPNGFLLAGRLGVGQIA